MEGIGQQKENKNNTEVSKVTKLLSIVKGAEAFQDFLSKSIEARTIPVAHVTCTESNVPPALPPYALGVSHSKLCNLVEGEIVAQAFYTHPLYHRDNSKMYTTSAKKQPGPPNMLDA